MPFSDDSCSPGSHHFRPVPATYALWLNVLVEERARAGEPAAELAAELAGVQGPCWGRAAARAARCLVVPTLVAEGTGATHVADSMGHAAAGRLLRQRKP